MKIKNIWMMALLLLICSMPALFASCDDEKDDQTKADVTGRWYAEYEKTGTEGQISYSKVIQYYEFEAGGQGYWTKFLLNADKCVYQYGGLTGLEDADGAFRYSIDNDGTIHIKLNKGGDNSEWRLL